MHHEVRDEVRTFVNKYVSAMGNNICIADIGAYDVNGNLRDLFQRSGWVYTGFDMSSGPNVDIVLPASHDWPDVPSASFDVVVSVSTLEHTPRPWLVVKEMSRIVKQGGLVCFTAPYAWPFHQHPIDCWRIYPDAMRAIMEDADLDVMETKMVSASRSAGAGTWLGDTVGIGRKR